MQAAAYTAAASAGEKKTTNAPVTTSEEYSNLVKRHRVLQDKRRQDAGVALKDLQDKTDKAVTSLVNQSTDRQKAVTLIQTERKVDDSVKALHAASLGTQQRLTQWGAMFVGFQSALKDLGDLANWSQAVESDVKDAVNILEAVVKAKAAHVSSSS